MWDQKGDSKFVQQEQPASLANEGDKGGTTVEPAISDFRLPPLHPKPLWADPWTPSDLHLFGHDFDCF